jgi:DNA modification methylase
MDKMIEKGIKVDLVLTDPPYGTTQCKWDTIIPFDKMWERLNKLIELNTAVILFGSEPYTSTLIYSNIKNFKYNWIWEKDKATGHLNAKKQPMRKIELISVFYNKQCLYIPQLSQKPKENIRPATTKRKNIDNYGNMDKESVRGIPIDMSYPNETLKFRGCFGDKGKSYHPTQKPVDLLEYLINTYTNEGNLILDFTCGSGSTLIAAKNTNRKCIGIELNEKYCEIAKNRIQNHTISSDKKLITPQHIDIKCE